MTGSNLLVLPSITTCTNSPTCGRVTCWSAAGSSLAVASRTAHEIGHVATLRLAEFQRAAESFLHLQSTAVFGEVVLAFLPEVLKRQAMRIFTLFGF
jgi:hypothetical protein